MSSSSSSTKNDDGAVTSNNVDLKPSEEHVDDDICVDDFHPSPSSSSTSSLFHRGIHRMKEMFHNLNGMEISGSLGDLGTFIPLTMALAKNRSIYIAPTLFFAGLSNLVTGIVWDVPMPVQPMKSISAVAIADVWTPQLMATSGITVGVLVLLLGLSNFMDLVNKIIPLSVVSGMQIGLGFRLMSTGMNDIVDLRIWVGNYGDCILVALLLSIGALFWLRELPQQHLDELRVLVDQQQNNNHRSAEERQQQEEIQHGSPNVSAFKDENTEKNASQCRPCSTTSDSTSSNTDEEEQRQLKTKKTLAIIDNEPAGTTTSPLLEAQSNSQMQDAFGTDSKHEPLLLTSDQSKDEKDVSRDTVAYTGISLPAVKDKTPPEENVIAPSSTLERTNQSIYRSVVDSGTKNIDDSDNHDEKIRGFHQTLSLVLRCLCCCIPALGRPKNKGTNNMTLHPVGVYLFLCGCIFAVVKLVSTRREDSETTGWSWFDAPVAVWALEGVVPNDWKVGLLEGAIPQLPLTTLNSVIAVCALCTALFPEKIPTTKEPEHEQTQQTTATTRSTSHRRWWLPKICQADEQQSEDVVTRRTVSVSVGLMNLVLCPFGSMPNCHGAGGLAGQYRFGARTGTSVAFLGICKMLLSVFMGTSILLFLDAYPVSILGIMICISGSELAVTGWTVLAQHIQKQGETEFNQQVQSILGLSSAQEEDDDEARLLLTNNVRSKYYKTFMRQQVFVCLVTAAVMVGLGRTDIGVLSGWLANFIYADGYKPYMAFLKRCLPCCGGRKNNNESRTD